MNFVNVLSKTINHPKRDCDSACQMLVYSEHIKQITLAKNKTILHDLLLHPWFLSYPSKLTQGPTCAYIPVRHNLGIYAAGSFEGHFVEKTTDLV